VVGADRLPRAWETVNIVIDSEQVRLGLARRDIMGLNSGSVRLKIRI
jgi:hypothetical protein